MIEYTETDDKQRREGTNNEKIEFFSLSKWNKICDLWCIANFLKIIHFSYVKCNKRKAQYSMKNKMNAKGNIISKFY